MEVLTRTPNEDLVAKQCVAFFYAIIQNAAHEARFSLTARRFFESPYSPFWDYCAHLAIDANVVAEKVLRNTEKMN